MLHCSRFDIFHVEQPAKALMRNLFVELKYKHSREAMKREAIFFFIISHSQTTKIMTLKRDPKPMTDHIKDYHKKCSPKQQEQ